MKIRPLTIMMMKDVDKNAYKFDFTGITTCSLVLYVVPKYLETIFIFGYKGENEKRTIFNSGVSLIISDNLFSSSNSLHKRIVRHYSTTMRSIGGVAIIPFYGGLNIGYVFNDFVCF